MIGEIIEQGSHVVLRIKNKYYRVAIVIHDTNGNKDYIHLN